MFACIALWTGVWANSVDSLEIRKHVQYLASPELKGRYPGTEGAKKAAEYICKKFIEAGCEPLFDKGFQEFDMPADSTQKGINVVAMLKGTKTPNEYIVVGAHYDHLGMGGKSSRSPDTVAVHPGADDNASGVAALLESAKALVALKPERSVIFVAFSGEETGLIGSKYLVENLHVPKESVKAMLNFDMLGNLDSILNIHGTGTATFFDSLLTMVSGNGQDFRIERRVDGFGPSDHSSFYAEKIPVLFFHTPETDAYHTPFDVPESVNIAGIATITDYGVRVVEHLAKASTKIDYQDVGGTPMRRGSMGSVSLGILPDHNSNNGLKINGVRPESLAHKLNLQKNDIIVEINGHKVSDIYTYMEAMKTLEKGKTISVSYFREGKKQDIKANI